jgi:hypothetical protein
MTTIPIEATGLADMDSSGLVVHVDRGRALILDNERRLRMRTGGRARGTVQGDRGCSGVVASPPFGGEPFGGGW